MKRRSLLWLPLLPTLGWYLAREEPAADSRTPKITDFLGRSASPDAFARVLAPRAFEFPRDHAAHEEFRHEWWYFTGNLRDTDGRPFGFQLTFFRFALAATAPSTSSAWSTRHALLAHFAVTDVRAKRFHAFQRLERPVLGIGGFASEPPTVWVRDWRATWLGSAWGLEARAGNATLHLTATPRKPILAQGDRGYSRKGAASGNASLYYSATQMEVAGSLAVGTRPRQVTGAAWLDREWGTSALAGDVVGWDWFGLQLSDGSELTLYLLRRKDGSRTRFSAGSWHGPQGEAVSLSSRDVSVRALGRWRSPDTGTRYPSGWTIEVARLRLSLRITPRIPNQEWHHLFRYWEGCVEVSGTCAGTEIDGVGYAELTGYE